jgi:hypothetical protein
MAALSALFLAFMILPLEGLYPSPGLLDGIAAPSRHLPPNFNAKFVPSWRKQAHVDGSDTTVARGEER